VKNLDWPAIIFASTVMALLLAVTDVHADTWVGKGTWHPTSDLKEVTVMVNWTHQKQVPCGEHKGAQACAFPPTESDIPRKGTLCVITHPKFHTSPTDQEFAKIGELFDICVKQAESRLITIRWERDETNIGAVVYPISVAALPCGISISPNLRLDFKGHEVLHCSRGHWHD